MDVSIACCLCVRNCAPYLPKIIDNLDRLSQEFSSFQVVFVYDNCSDDTADILALCKAESNYPVHVIHLDSNNSPLRTVRIANARNACLECVYTLTPPVDFHIMIDADEVNCSDWDNEVIRYYLKKDTWDALSFNRLDYYDIWALMYDPYRYHCMGFGKYWNEVRRYFKKEIYKKLNSIKGKDELLKCLSAFNGFAIYRTKCMEGIRYDGLNKHFLQLVSPEDIHQTEHLLQKRLGNTEIKIDNTFQEVCEHIYYHLKAIQKNNARIRISKTRVQKQNLMIEIARNPKLFYYLFTYNCNL